MKSTKLFDKLKITFESISFLTPVMKNFPLLKIVILPLVLFSEQRKPENSSGSYSALKRPPFAFDRRISL